MKIILFGFFWVLLFMCQSELIKKKKAERKTMQRWLNKLCNYHMLTAAGRFGYFTPSVHSDIERPDPLNLLLPWQEIAEKQTVLIRGGSSTF